MDKSTVDDLRDEIEEPPVAGGRKRLTNRDVAAELALIGDILQILGDNKFRVIAFQNAAEAIRTFGQDVNSLHAEGKLTSIPGVGKAIAVSVGALLEHGEAKDFEELIGDIDGGRRREVSGQDVREPVLIRPCDQVAPTLLNRGGGRECGAAKDQRDWRLRDLSVGSCFPCLRELRVEPRPVRWAGNGGGFRNGLMHRSSLDSSSTRLGGMADAFGLGTEF